MRRLLVDHGRHQKRDKRGGGVAPMALDDLLKAADTAARADRGSADARGGADAARSRDARAAQVVVLRFFSGMSSPEVAEHLQVSVRTVEADWTYARAWLKRELAGERKQTRD